jgi:ribosomal protein S18 acetylase RimI-like enzyme
MGKFRRLHSKDEPHLPPLFKQLTGKEITINTTSLLSDPNCHCVVLEIEEKVGGFGALIIHQVPTKGKVARVEDIVIDEKHRGKGFGRKLLEELLVIAKKQEVEIIDLTSNPSRVPARKLYESLGFELRDTGVFRLKL